MSASDFNVVKRRILGLRDYGSKTAILFGLLLVLFYFHNLALGTIGITEHKQPKAQVKYGLTKISDNIARSNLDLKVSNKNTRGKADFRKVSNNREKDNKKIKNASNNEARRLPQCLVIGVRKGGTMALLTFLNLHPDIVTADRELHFFEVNNTYKRGLSYYRRQMPLSYEGQITVEKTPEYFTRKLTPERVYHMNSSIRLLLVVRDPITRLVSDYAMKAEKTLQKGGSYPSLESLALDKNGNVNSEYYAMDFSTYHLHLSNWLKYFPKQQIHVVDGDKLVFKPFVEMEKIENFLGIRHSIKKDMFYFNKSKGFYCIKEGDESSCLAETKGRMHPDVDPVLIDKLKEYFKPLNEAFFDLVGRTFNW